MTVHEKLVEWEAWCRRTMRVLWLRLLNREEPMSSFIAPPTIKCYYSCAVCKTNKRFVDVPERTEGQPIKEWLDTVLTVALMTDHKKKSPFCRTREFAEVGIPHSGDGQEPVGSKTRS